MTTKAESTKLYFLLESAIKLAVHLHSLQWDKAGKPYILHPLYLMKQVRPVDYKICAVLHDIFKDMKLTFIEFRYKYDCPEDIMYTLMLLTRGKNIPYYQYIIDLSKDDRARQIKILDLEHNMDLSRFDKVKVPKSKKFVALQRKYDRAWNFLRNYITEDIYKQLEQERLTND